MDGAGRVSWLCVDVAVGEAVRGEGGTLGISLSEEQERVVKAASNKGTYAK